ncbi:VOC family protein [Novosphingobium resinovorum]|uniref:VOC family protein n=1 Tax=Novosphingobium resinovorum TaxID=158500 RepID=UPI002ED6A4B7|nr:VOC family protein [Novosphingobium resinovorum]
MSGAAQGLAGSLAFHHAAMSVPDIEAAAQWYEDVLGFRVERRFAIPGGTQAMFLEREGLRIELFQVADPRPMPVERLDPREDLKTLGNKHAAFTVADYDGFRADLIARGIEPVLEVGEAFGRGLFIRDGAGNVIEFLER